VAIIVSTGPENGILSMFEFPASPSASQRQHTPEESRAQHKLILGGTPGGGAGV
jgi:hypothetical protein